MWRVSRLPIVGCLVLFLTPFGMARGEKVLPPDQHPQDLRYGKLKTLDDYFPFRPPQDLASWERRRERVQRQILVAAGLWPMPERPPIQPVIHGLVDRDDYTVEKVYFESFPGFYVTGNLYRPKHGKKPYPVVLSPHGHWQNGRFYDAGAEKVLWDIVNGAERFERGGRYPLQARCVQLARMGCVVFHYDMVGYADSVQLPHRPGVRKHMNTEARWGYFSPAAELHLQNMLGLQTFNSIRALDFVCSLPDVDTTRIGVTGASGGGTQTFLLCAVDPRPTVSFPAVMVSTAMQGGCTCENACYLRIDTGNVEFAALFAPKPLGMTAADDWTKEIATKGLPELKQLYSLYGVPDLVMAKPLLHFPHNYNFVSREVMYHWMNKHLRLGLKEPIVENDFEPLSREEMTVWDEAHPRPPGGEEWERSFLERLTALTRGQLARLVPHDQADWEEYRRIIGGAYDVMIGRSVPPPEEVAVELLRSATDAAGERRAVLMKQTVRQEVVPAWWLMPAGEVRAAVIWLGANGKQDFFDAEGGLIPAVKELRSRGFALVLPDLIGQGEATPDGQPFQKARLVREDYAGYTFGYNPPLFAQRVHDVLLAIRAVKMDPVLGSRPLVLIGLKGAGHWVAAARAQAGTLVDLAVVDTAGFRFREVNAFDDVNFFPGAAKYFDLPGVLSLSAPLPLWLAGETGESLELVQTVYRAAGAEAGLRVFEAMPPQAECAWFQELVGRFGK